MVVNPGRLVQLIRQGFPALMPEEVSHVNLTRTLGARRRRVLRRYADQVANDLDQPIAVLIHVAGKLFLQFDGIHQSSDGNANCLGRVWKTIEPQRVERRSLICMTLFLDDTQYITPPFYPEN
jgi:hypothetical protein